MSTKYQSYAYSSSKFRLNKYQSYANSPLTCR